MQTGRVFGDKWEGFLLFLDFLPLFPENLLHWRAARFRFDFPFLFFGGGKKRFPRLSFRASTKVEAPSISVPKLKRAFRSSHVPDNTTCVQLAHSPS